MKDWNKVSLSLPGRTNKDCRKRWGKISKEVKKGPWDALEDQRLQQAVLTLGPRWTNVAELVGTRHADRRSSLARTLNDRVATARFTCADMNCRVCKTLDQQLGSGA